MSHQTTSVWKCDLCPVEVESDGYPHGWFQFTGNDESPRISPLELDLCGHCAAPIIAASREHEAHEQRSNDSGKSVEAASAAIRASAR
jgi:hypothetical protein